MMPLRSRQLNLHSGLAQALASILPGTWGITQGHSGPQRVLVWRFHQQCLFGKNIYYIYICMYLYMYGYNYVNQLCLHIYNSSIIISPEWMWQTGRSSMRFIPEIDKASLQECFLAWFKATPSRNYMKLPCFTFQGFPTTCSYIFPLNHCKFDAIFTSQFLDIQAHDLILLVSMVAKGQSKVHTGSSQVVSHLQRRESPGICQGIFLGGTGK